MQNAHRQRGKRHLPDPINWHPYPCQEWLLTPEERKGSGSGGGEFDKTIYYPVVGAVQVEPMKPVMKAPGTKRLKLKYVTLLSNSAFDFNLRCYPPGKVMVDYTDQPSFAMVCGSCPGRAW